MVSRTGVRPPWLRPFMIGTVAVLHLAVFTWTHTQAVVPASGVVEIDLVVDTQAVAQPTPEETPSAEARAEAPPPEAALDEPVAQPLAPPPDPAPTVDPEPALPPQPTPPVVEPERPRPVVEQTRPRKAAKPRRKPEQEMSRTTAEEESSARAARAASNAEAEEARRAAARSYGALVSAELQRHRIYPAAAREAGLTGVAVVGFVVGPGGTIASHHIVRSTGHAILDDTVHHIMASVALPPPPGGFYRSSIPIRFDMPR